MQPFELEVLEYIRSTGNHVLYRVTPVFEGDNLVASGVFMEGMSVEDQGKEVSFHVFVYNVQPGVIIDYSTGEKTVLAVKGRHDPCVVPRAVPVVEAMAAVAVYDILQGR
jgi:DNA-entry nuclease